MRGYVQGIGHPCSFGIYEGFVVGVCETLRGQSITRSEVECRMVEMGGTY